MNDGLERLTEVFRDVFDDDAIRISEGTEIKGIAGWDSLIHISLLTAVQDEFGIRFSMEEMEKIGTAGDILRLLQGVAQ